MTIGFAKRRKEGGGSGDETGTAPGAACRAARALGLTQDILAGTPRLEAAGNREIFIEGCTGVMEYDGGTIKLAAGAVDITLTGQGLALRCLSGDAAVIDGLVDRIDFARHVKK